MPNFIHTTDREIIAYLVDHFHELEIGAPDAGLAERLIAGIENDALAIEKCEDGFAVIAKANRKHPGAASFIKIAPESDLMFLYVAPTARSQRTGSTFLTHVQSKYMEDQAMILVCASSRRRAFFERAGFVSNGVTHEGHNFMVCPARAFADNG